MSKLMTVAQFRKQIPGARGAEAISPATVTRWILSGCPALNGARVKLSATRAGGRWLISQEDADAFFAKLQATEGVEESRSPAARNRAAEAAAKELEAMGA